MDSEYGLDLMDQPQDLARQLHHNSYPVPQYRFEDLTDLGNAEDIRVIHARFPRLFAVTKLAALVWHLWKH